MHWAPHDCLEAATSLPRGGTSRCSLHLSSRLRLARPCMTGISYSHFFLNIRTHNFSNKQCNLDIIQQSNSSFHRISTTNLIYIKTRCRPRCRFRNGGALRRRPRAPTARRPRALIRVPLVARASPLLPRRRVRRRCRRVRRSGYRLGGRVCSVRGVITRYALIGLKSN
jgi:hypothetical protein